MKTIDRMAENGPRNSKVVYPAEIGRAEWSLDHPPSAVGLKLLLLLVSSLGDAVAADMVHEVPVGLLRQVPGLAGMSKDDLEIVLLDLARVQARLDQRDPDNPKRGSVTFGALLSTVRIHYSDDAVLACHVRFGDVFRDMVAASELFAVIDRAAALSMKSRYSLLLYQFLATHWRKDRQRQIKLPLSELRRVFALSAEQYPQFGKLNEKAISPALAEISASSPFNVTAKPYYEGSRAVAGVVLAWDAKAGAKPAGSSVRSGSAAGDKVQPKRRGWAAPARAAKVTPQAQQAAFQSLADRLNGGRYVSPSEVSTAKAAALLSSGLVSADVLRDRGIAF